MQVIALVTQKGGCGKSTLALSLAVAARGVNRRTLILDTDPQRTVSTWWQDREQDTPDCVEVFESTALPKALDLAKQKRFNWCLLIRQDGMTPSTPASLASPISA